MIIISRAVVRITEETLNQLLLAVKEAKEIIDFTKTAFPDGDMDMDSCTREHARRGRIRVSAKFEGISFDIILSGKQEQESLRYELEYEKE